MKTFLIMGLILISSLVHAETISGRIHSIENGMVKFENGRVAYLVDSNLDLASLANSDIEATLDGNSNIVSARKIKLPVQKSLLVETIYVKGPPSTKFEPTVVQGRTEAFKIFNRSNSNFKRYTECTDRAHVWAHDEFKKNGIKSEKVFVFFTASYIIRVRAKWWFHVAPLYTVNNNGSIEKLVMDYMYTSSPVTIKEWTDKMVFSKRACKFTTKFSEYDVNPQTEDCYLMVESMHYRLPGEMFEQETQKSNTYKVGTSPMELRNSFNAAFYK